MSEHRHHFSISKGDATRAWIECRCGSIDPDSVRDLTSPYLGPADAKARRRVMLRRPGRHDVIVTLVLWPIPADQRRPGERRGPHKRAGKKAIVILPSGARLSVDPDHVHPLEEGAAT